jgi:hypothetical protein
LIAYLSQPEFGGEMGVILVERGSVGLAGTVVEVPASPHRAMLSHRRIVGDLIRQAAKAAS